MKKMKEWLTIFCEKKGIQIEKEFFKFEKEGQLQIISLDILITNIIPFSEPMEQEQIKEILVKLDFHNGDIMDFFKHLAEGYIFTNF